MISTYRSEFSSGIFLAAAVTEPRPQIRRRGHPRSQRIPPPAAPRRSGCTRAPTRGASRRRNKPAVCRAAPRISASTWPSRSRRARLHYRTHHSGTGPVAADGAPPPSKIERSREPLHENQTLDFVGPFIGLIRRSLARTQRHRAPRSRTERSREQVQVQGKRWCHATAPNPERSPYTGEVAGSNPAAPIPRIEGRACNATNLDRS